MADRYFCETPISLGSVTLGGPEAHHLIHVMRVARGARIVLFDGSGAEFPAMVERVDRNSIEFTVQAREEIDRELPFDLTLGVALPKGDRQKWLVEKAVELGVTRMVPLRTERGVAQPVEQALARLRRSVIEASKQCGRNRLMEITEPSLLDDYLENNTLGPCRLFAQPKGFHASCDLQSLISILSQKTSEEKTEEEIGEADIEKDASTDATPTASPKVFPQGVALAVGPEGGFSPSEVPLAVAAGWHTIDLGPRILRVETAALVLASLITQLASLGRCVQE